MMRLLAVALVIVTVVALAMLPLSSAGLVVAGAAVVLATLIRPEFSLYLLAFAVPFGSLRSVSLGGASVTATEILVALLAAAWLGRGVMQRRICIVHAPLSLPLVLVILSQLLSLFDALSLSMAAIELIKWSEVLAVYIIASSILSGAGSSPLATASTRRILVSLLLVATLAEALLGVYQFIWRAGPEWFLIGRFMRAYGTFNQPNPYAGYLNLSLPLGYALLLAGDHRGRSSQKKDVVLGVWLMVVGGALLMSFSRGAWLGFAVAFVVIGFLHSRRTAMLMAVGAAMLAITLVLGSAQLLPTAVTARFSSITDYIRIFDARHVKVTDANFAVVERMAHWQAAWGMFNDRPWLGYGIGNYPAAYVRYALAGWKEDLGHAHNYLLNVMAETGLVGLAAYLVFVVAALWVCLAAVRSSAARGHAFARAVALGILGVLCAKLTHEMLDDLWVHGMGVQVALLLALVSTRMSDQSPVDPEPGRSLGDRS
jgi:putative inorganic carbon (hco3(-)) transporter